MTGPQLVYSALCPLPVTKVGGFTSAEDLAHTSKLFLNNLALVTRAYMFFSTCLRLTLETQTVVKSELPGHGCAVLTTAPTALHQALAVKLGFRSHSLCRRDVRVGIAVQDLLF